MVYHYIEQQAEQLLPYLKDLRMDFHRHPETAWEEMRTSEKISAILARNGYKVIRGTDVAGHDTGVIGILQGCDPDGPVLALRFDIDGLPVQESSAPSHLPFKEGFASQNPGKMHACGHDGHTAIGIGCAVLLSRMKDYLKGTVKLIFQPAEEGARGALPIVKKGWLDNVDYFLAAHIFDRSAKCPVNCNIIPGVSHSLATTKTDLFFHGRCAHAAHPEQGVDVIPAMADTILRLSKIKGEGFIHTGTIHGGSGRNIIAGYGKLELETRAPSTGRDRELNRILKKISDEISVQYHVSCDLQVTGSAPALESSPQLVKKLTDLFAAKVPSLHPLPHMIDFPASEDAAHMMNRVKERGGQTAFMLLPAKLAADLHHASFDFPMELMVTGVTAFVSASCALLQNPDA
ncbi:MAG: amidohydrolase [Ruminococcus sp.]|jgi:aminobenzoyl-glutamate utilization protein A